ncbi:ABC transporter permease, partial [Lentzea indica]|uniref:ABC transporter permease n=1 Tax=Lentzea indica TaxID=2604800 RepID=UPI0035E4269F
MRSALADRSADVRASWPPLPRRSRPPRTVLTIRTPISRRAKTALTVGSLAVPFSFWVLLSASGAVPATFLPSPGAVLSAGWEMARSGELAVDMWATTRRVLEGFGLAVLVSVPLGVLMGTFHAGQAAFEPVIGLLRYLPAGAFIPLLIIWLGLGEPSKIAILFIGTVFFN